jgi:hypothetical protein
MTKAEARHHVGNGSEWLEMPHGPVAGAKLDDEGKLSEADSQRVRDAVEKIATEMETRSRRLQRSRINRLARKNLRP